ncbi:peptidase [Haloferax sp. S1W]|uniref:peptidase n=1 Tax=Haloferax sp. S1W TaxID=3377110 RepID=UPI0037C88767
MPPVTFAAALVGVSLLGAGWSRMSAGRLAKRDAPVQEFRRRVHSNWLLAAALFAVCAWFFELNADLLALAGLPTRWPWTLLGWSGIAVGAALVATVSYMGAFPVARRVRDVDMGAFTAAVKMFRYHVVIAAMILSVVVVYRIDLRYGVSSGAATVAVFTLAAYLFSTPLVGLSQTTMEPDADTRSRLDRLTSRVGLSVSQTRLLEGYGHRSDHFVRGPVGRKTLFVTDSLLEKYDDDVVGALLATEAEQSARFTRELHLLSVAVFGGLALSGLAPENSFFVYLGIGLVALVLGAQVSQRLTIRADDAAAKQVGCDTLADALEATADEVDQRHSGSFLSPTLSSEARIERLRNAEAAATDSPDS